jgi:hypothetical protein
MLTHSKNLIAKHRAAFPGTGFTAINGERMSDRDDNRLWDMLWRVFKARNKPILKRSPDDIWCELALVPHPEEARKNARTALARLGSWYRVPSSPHAAFAEVH